MLALHLPTDSRSMERFMREARLASALDHPNICTIYEVGTEDGKSFISMQYVEGDTVQRAIDGGALPTARWLSIALQVADALRAAHGQGIIHRDMKSSNIMVTPRGQAKVLDFGVAKMLDRSDASGADAELTRAGATVGTPSYLSPEAGTRRACRSPQRHLLPGDRVVRDGDRAVAVQRASAAEVMHAIINEPHTSVSEINKDVPLSLATVIDRALAKDPAARYQSVYEMMVELREVAQAIGWRSNRWWPTAAMRRWKWGWPTR